MRLRLPSVATTSEQVPIILATFWAMVAVVVFVAPRPDPTIRIAIEHGPRPLTGQFHRRVLLQSTGSGAGSASPIPVPSPSPSPSPSTLLSPTATPNGQPTAPGDLYGEVGEGLFWLIIFGVALFCCCCYTEHSCKDHRQSMWFWRLYAFFWYMVIWLIQILLPKKKRYIDIVSNEFYSDWLWFNCATYVWMGIGVVITIWCCLVRHLTVPMFAFEDDPMAQQKR